MKLALCITLLALNLCFSSCSPTKSGLQTEAERRAQLWWNANVARCGEDYYTQVRWADVIMGQFVREDELYQLKNASYLVKETPLTEAGKLNGIEWQGTIVILATAHRKRYTDNSGWSAWTDGVPQYQSPFMRSQASSVIDKAFNKEKGKWSIGEDGKDSDGDPTHRKPDCSTIPPG